MKQLFLCNFNFKKYDNYILRLRKQDKKKFRIENDLKVEQLKQEFKNKPFILKAWD